VADRVVFTGRVDEDRKADHYRLADAFVMPGRGEGFGIVYLEALACGVPVVGSVLDGSRDALLNGRLGILVDPDDREDLIRGIREALRRPKGVVPALLSEFSEARYVERVHAILDAIAGGALARA
jgi:glycosyltransferase involved in cell wall biosynthesis